jgi:hypothetical protein
MAKSKSVAQLVGENGLPGPGRETVAAWLAKAHRPLGRPVHRRGSAHSVCSGAIARAVTSLVLL